MQKAFFFGWFYPLVVIMVDRNSSRSRAQSMISMKECLRKGISMCIFPEGSMNRSDQPLTDFHEGAFYLAIEMQVPVFPVVFTNTRKLLPASMDYVYPGIVGVQFLKPVPTTGMTRSQVPQLKAQVQALMLEQLRQQESLLKSA
jgi:1-acyl-sn-glycerol-3-phosphate acyltransferase